MQVSVESGEGLQKRMTVALPSAQVTEAVEKRLKEIARTARLDGFRPGRVPMNVVRKRFGGQIRQEVFGDLVQSTFYEAASKESLRPAGYPQIEPLEDKGNEDFSYTAVFEVMPAIELKGFGEGALKRPVAQVTDADVDAMIEKLRQQRRTWNKVERAAADGDRLIINFKGMMDGEAFEGGSGNQVPLVMGSKSMIDGFEAGLVGAAAGETRKLDLKFPEPYHAEQLAGKPVTFEVEVVSVSESVLPELNHEFAKAFGVADGGIDKLREDIRKNMERELADRVQARIKAQVMDALLAANPIDVPKVMVEEEISSLQQEMRERVSGGNRGANFELPRDLFEEQAKRRVSLGLLVAEVIKANQIRLDNERVQKHIADFASSYEDPEGVIQYYNQNKQQRAAVESVVLEDQVVDWALGQINVEDEPSTFTALTEQAQ